MNLYLLSVSEPDGPRPPAEFLAKVMRDVAAFEDEIRAAGAWVFNGALHPPSAATMVRVKDGGAFITDGPFAEGKEIRAFLLHLVRERKLAAPATRAGTTSRSQRFTASTAWASSTSPSAIRARRRRTRRTSVGTRRGTRCSTPGCRRQGPWGSPSRGRSARLASQ